tara:strand:- start:287 stop:1417 length:1131 start_codon:yes stop_codon:yes gene_type:complete
MSSVTIQSLNKNYGTVRVLNNVSLEIEDKDFAVIVGPSGCGKSTLLRIISGLEEHETGDIFFDDQRVNEISSSKRGVGMVFQAYALFPHLTVEKNIAFGMRMRRENKSKIDAKVAEVAKILKLEPYLKRLPKHLSGGQRQRVAIGRSIVREPKVFLFDEPLSNLDAEMRVEMRLELSKLHRSLGATMIFVTHDQVEAMTLGTKIVVMNEGVIQQAAKPLEIYYYPANKFVAGFIGSPSMQFLSGTVISSNNESVSVEIKDVSPNVIKVACDGSNVSPGDKLDIGIRPEDLGTKKDLSLPSITGLTSAVEYMGTTSFWYGTTKDNQSLIAQLGREEYVELDSEVTLKFDPAHLYLFDANGLSVPRLNVEIPDKNKAK